MKRAGTGSLPRSSLILLASTVILIFCTSALLLQNYQLSQTNQQVLKELVNGEKQRVSTAIEKLLPYALKTSQEIPQNEPQVELAVSRTVVNDTLDIGENEQSDLVNENRLDFSASPDQKPKAKVLKTPTNLNTPNVPVQKKAVASETQASQQAESPDTKGEANHFAKMQADLLRGKIDIEKGKREAEEKTEQKVEVIKEEEKKEEVKEEPKAEVEEEAVKEVEKNAKTEKKRRKRKKKNEN